MESYSQKAIAFVSCDGWTLFNFRGEVIRSLIKRGFQVIIIAGKDGYVDLLQDMGCQYVPFKMNNRSLNPLHDLNLFLQLRRIYEKYRPDFIFHYLVKLNIYGTLAAAFMQIPSVAVVTGLGHAFKKAGLLQTITKSLYRLSLLYSYQIWCLHVSDAEFLISNRLVSSRKTRVLDGEGVDTDYYIKQSLKEAAPRPFVFLLTTRLLQTKGIREYAKAAIMLRKKKLHVECLLVGRQDKHPDAVSAVEVKKWEAEHSITYLGFSDDVRSYLNQADCFVYPSYYNEGIPRSLLEACSMELPVITTDSNGCRDLVLDGINGFVCKRQDGADLALKMEAIMMLDKHQRQYMGKMSREMVLQKYAVRDTINSYLNFLDGFFDPAFGASGAALNFNAANEVEESCSTH